MTSQGDDEDEARARRPRDRAQLRAALALEEAGELQEAARMFEYVGEHAQAASLRLEHADTLRDEQQRLAVLREGCARNPATTVQGQALHRALGEALLRVAEGLEPGARRRALALEAAQALEDGRRSGEAGRLYEQLGLLSRAAKAFTDAGDIERLEAIHEVLEQRQQRQRAQRSLELEVEAALTTGRRQLAQDLLIEHTREAQRDQQAPLPSLAQSLHDLERRMIRGQALALELRTPNSSARTVVRVVGRERLRIGRSPECEVTVSGAALSREHVELGMNADPSGRPYLFVRDLGSRAGSFLDGEVLAPGDDWALIDLGGPTQRELALGIASSLELWTRSDMGGSAGPRPQALVREAGLGPADTPVHAWTCFAPLSGDVWVEPSLQLPVSLSFDRGWVTAKPSPDLSVSLNGVPVGQGEPIELLVHDRLGFEITRDGGHAELAFASFDLEVLELWGMA